VKKALFLIPLLAAAAQSQENYATAWSGHKYVIVNSFLAGTTAPLVKFPVLVRLDSTHAAVFTQAKAGGADLRFTKANNTTRLPHQIDSWNATARTAAIWVLADTIPASRSNHALRLHWGNASAADSSNGAQVFDTSNAFQAVWHMSGSANETDATVNGFTAAQVGTPASATAAVGTGRTVTSGNYFRAAGTASGKLNFPEGGNYSLSAWVFCNSLPSAGTVISKHDNAYALKLNADANSWEFFEFGTAATAAGWNWVNAPVEGSLGAWTHLVGVHTANDVALYVNGFRMDGGFSTATSTAARVETRDVVIGAQPAGSNTTVQRPFDGIVDEVRMASAARDADWIRLEFETQKAGSTAVRVLDTIPVSLAPAAPRATFSVRGHGNGLLFSVNATGAARARLEVLDMRGLTVSSTFSDLRGGTLAWDGTGSGGRLAPQGVYAVRITLLNAQGRVVRTLEKKVPFTR
jgi:biopolymer transport protein ExbB